MCHLPLATAKERVRQTLTGFQKLWVPFTPPAEEEGEEEEEEEVPKQKKIPEANPKQPVDLKKFTVSLGQQLNKLTRIRPGNIVIDLQFVFEHFQVELGEQIKTFKKVNAQSLLLDKYRDYLFGCIFSSWCLSKESPRLSTSKNRALNYR